MAGLAKLTGKKSFEAENDPAVKLGLMRSRVSSAVQVLQRSILNLPQAEVDGMAGKLKGIVEKVLNLTETRLDELIKDDKKRAYLGLKDLSGAAESFLLLRQGMAGFTTKTETIRYDEVVKTLEEISAAEVPINERIGELLKLVEVEEAKRKALPAPAEVEERLHPILHEVIDEKIEVEVPWIDQARSQKSRAARVFLVDNGMVSPEGKFLKKKRGIKLPAWVACEFKYAD